MTRAGLTLDINDLKKVGMPAILMCFVPAMFEILAVAIFAPMFLGVSRLDALIIGSIIASVSPALVMPRMIMLIEKSYGTEHKVPQLILAGASAEDVFCIVIFTALIDLARAGEISYLKFLSVPISIVLGTIAGYFIGYLLIKLFKIFLIRDTVKIAILFSVSFLLLEFEKVSSIPFSGLIAIMSSAIALRDLDSSLADRLSQRYNKLWIIAEIFLFVLVGASVNVSYAFSYGFVVILLVLAALVFRMIGVYVSILKTNFTKKERLFTMLAYTPKLPFKPLLVQFHFGDMALTVAVLSILITAPFGAIMIDKFYDKLLDKSNRHS